MKRNLVILMAVSLFAAAAPVWAAEGHQHGGAQPAMDEQCAKECDMLLKNCAQEVDTIQARILKLKAAIKKEGADANAVKELKSLNAKLQEANQTLADLEKPGK